MWYAMIMVSVLHPVNGVGNFRLVDNRGPYAEKTQCVERQKEMMSKAPDVMGPGGMTVLYAVPLPCTKDRPAEYEGVADAI